MNRIDPATIEVIHEYVKRVKAAGIPVTEVRLFGSRARGNFKPWSDIDIALISPNFGHDTFEEMGQLLKIAAHMKKPYPIEPVPFSPEDLNDPWSTLANEIRQYGIKIDD